MRGIVSVSNSADVPESVRTVTSEGTSIESTIESSSMVSREIESFSIKTDPDAVSQFSLSTSRPVSVGDHSTQNFSFPIIISAILGYPAAKYGFSPATTFSPSYEIPNFSQD